MLSSATSGSQPSSELANPAGVVTLNADRPDDPSLWHVSFLDKKRSVTTVSLRDVQCRCHPEVLHPFRDHRSHVRRLHMRATAQLYVAIRLPAVLAVKHAQVSANLLDPGR